MGLTEAVRIMATSLNCLRLVFFWLTIYCLFCCLRVDGVLCVSIFLLGSAYMHAEGSDLEACLVRVETYLGCG